MRKRTRKIEHFSSILKESNKDYCHQLQVVAGPDHVCPKAIIGLELEEAVLTPPFFDHKGVIVRLALKSPSILATVVDL